MSMPLLVELVQRIEETMNEYAAGWRNTDALRIIMEVFRKTLAVDRVEN
jgi:hypothetical protein